MTRAISTSIVPRGFRGPALAAVAVGVLLFATTGDAAPLGPVRLGALFVVTLLVSAFTPWRQTADARGAMPSWFVVVFIALLECGAWPASALAAAGVIASGQLVKPGPDQSARRTLLNAAAAMLGIVAAGLVRDRVIGSVDGLAWAVRTLASFAAGAACFVVVGTSALAIGRITGERRLTRRTVAGVILEFPPYAIGVSLAVTFVELADAGLWIVAVVATVPVALLLRAYVRHLSRAELEHRRSEVIAFVHDGMAVIDESGRVTMWDEALEHLSGCAQSPILGRSLTEAVPALRDTPLGKAIADTLAERTGRTVSPVRLSSSPNARIARIDLVPVAGGATLLWRDITENAQAEQTLKRTAERLALAAEGANDGLWEWDLRTGDLFVSARWKALLGIPESEPVARVERWLERVHPEDAASLNEAVRALLASEAERLEHEHRIRHEDGTYRWFLCRGVTAMSARKPARLAGSLTDTTERVTAHERLRSAGFLDPLTGLRNRTDFIETLGSRLDQFKRRPLDGRFAVLYLDLDRFKVINDSLGHLVGDELLVAVSRRLESCLRQDDCLGRLGGDEFAILLNVVGDETQANAIAFRIEKALSAPLSVAGREVFTSVSIGIAFGNPQYANPDEIMRDADTAMYHAKARGKARHELFDADMHARVRDRLGLENDLRHAVDARAFEVHYQPIVLLGSGMCVGFESLIRWNRNGEPVSPATFVPLAEELGLIEALGGWVLREACCTFADWRRRFPNSGLDYITVNASSRQIAQQHFPLEVEQALLEAKLDPAYLRIEVTETALLDSAQHTVDVLAELRQFGVKIYLDDFGTGYSSLSHLHRLPVDALKIDRSFVHSLLLPERPAIVESILALARTMRTSVVAEGIEDDVQARELERLGCTHAQGYLFSRPLSAAAAEQLIIAGTPLGPRRLWEAAS